MEQVTIKVGGMSCQGCVKGVSAALQAVAGVTAVSVDLGAGEARVDFDPQQATVASLNQAVEDAGFEAG
ncbi:MAG TPA: cation transporter [Denitromonas sp.]|uniref:heavy-metal-associated domain-containing protein n=1 Tax=Denitromonas sp. TaxID=2734609 RepID=UPI001D240CB3|nr:heavy-metal-associated domain-containing protein [Rhodocyclaceae bacterium]MCP5221489.1 heavy-metal-associated domain-containing protein [Zoogloeaceae bacterium]HPR07360.1 cation transporter [Denitromonas sp.]HQU88300.1 cation transporter [Denitromonas sp.]HQV16272.1 cation transporter [Denitromonas sp.]